MNEQINKGKGLRGEHYETDTIHVDFKSFRRVVAGDILPGLAPAFTSSYICTLYY